jgi:hypothetical protein
VSEHAHHSQLVVHRVTWEHFPNEREEDVYVACAHCLAAVGLYVEPMYFEGGWDEGEWVPPGWSLEVERWDMAAFPFDPRAKLGEVCHRPAPDFPPSMREVWHRRGEEAKA